MRVHMRGATRPRVVCPEDFESNDYNVRRKLIDAFFPLSFRT